MTNLWDAPLPKEEQQGERDFPVLDPGTYAFEVVKATAKVYEPKSSSKIGRCAQIDLQLRMESKDSDVNVFDSLYGDPKTAWKMTQFAKCIKVFHEGMTPGELVKKAEGCVGSASVKVEEYNGKKRNKITAYIVPEEPQKNDDELPF